MDDLMRIQIREYIEFIKSFVEGADIMTKHFLQLCRILQLLLTSKKVQLQTCHGTKKSTSSEKKEERKTAFEENVSQLDQRLAIVQQGLIRTGVRTVQLDTEEVIELLYKIFNPGEQDTPVQMINQGKLVFPRTGI